MTELTRRGESAATELSLYQRINEPKSVLGAIVSTTAYLLAPLNPVGITWAQRKEEGMARIIRGGPPGGRGFTYGFALTMDVATYAIMAACTLGSTYMPELLIGAMFTYGGRRAGMDCTGKEAASLGEEFLTNPDIEVAE